MLEIAKRSLGIEGYQIGIKSFNELIGDAPKTLTLVLGAKAHSVICGFFAFTMPSLSKMIFSGRLAVIEGNIGAATDAASNLVAAMAGTAAGFYTKNADVGGAASFASNASLNVVNPVFAI